MPRGKALLPQGIQQQCHFLTPTSAGQRVFYLCILSCLWLHLLQGSFYIFLLCQQRHDLISVEVLVCLKGCQAGLMIVSLPEINSRLRRRDTRSAHVHCSACLLMCNHCLKNVWSLYTWLVSKVQAILAHHRRKLEMLSTTEQQQSRCT